ncbi:MAG: DUF2264 domain-containing protein [Liquorilactobacillus ghanensis]|uniref:DUF2264 domain-containing protein n=1 Tax=Liquorilactobacillus TaxID=2767888 RepID=UPI0039ECAB10
MRIGLKIHNKADILALFSKFEKGALQYGHLGNGRLKLGTIAPHYDDNQAQIEGFLRLLWGAGPRGKQGCGAYQLNFYEQGILNGVDPLSQYYWGKIHDYDQLMVEVASLDMFLLETKSFFWNQLSVDKQHQIVSWIAQINHQHVHSNNWRFFRVLTNVTLYKLDQPYSRNRLDEDLAFIDSCYVKGGWYFDGTLSQQDYYIAWAFHYYGLLYAHYMADVDPERAKRFTKRATTFAKSFAYWFDQDSGAGVPFGRSLTYKFAQVAFWSMLVYTNNQVLPWGQIKSMIFKNLQYWTVQELLHEDGTMAQGYAYDNPFIMENYNGAGSPYWAMKVFILLAVPDTHPFWRATQEPVPLVSKKVCPEANVLIVNEMGKNVQLFPVGQYTHQLHAADKYSKFVYSSLFGFSVQRGPLGLDQGAFDNVLAVSQIGYNHYQPKEKDQQHSLDDKKTTFTWSPQPGVIVYSYIVPLVPWHVRIHVIKTDHAIDYADGGFAVPTINSHKQDQRAQVQTSDGCVYVHNGLASGAYTQTIGARAIGITPVPDTNLLFPHTIIPTITGSLPAGKHYLYDTFFGCVTEQIAEVLVRRPQIKIVDTQVIIMQNQNCVTITLK